MCVCVCVGVGWVVGQNRSREISLGVVSVIRAKEDGGLPPAVKMGRSVHVLGVLNIESIGFLEA